MIVQGNLARSMLLFHLLILAIIAVLAGSTRGPLSWCGTWGSPFRQSCEVSDDGWGFYDIS